MSNKEPRQTSPRKCRHCGNIAPMAIVATYSGVAPFEDGPDSCDAGNIYDLLLCPSCTEITLRSYFWSDGMTDEDVRFRTLYPTTRRSPLGLPEPIQRAYEAAMKVKPVDPNAFGVLLGRTLEMVCLDRGADGRFLSDKLCWLAEHNEIPAKLVGVSTALSRFRNVGAHAGLGELTEKHIPILEDLCQAILAYVYTAPFLAQQAKDALDAVRAKGKAKTAKAK